MEYTDYVPTEGPTARDKKKYLAPGVQKPKPVTKRGVTSIEARAEKMASLFNTELELGTHFTKNSLAVQWLTDLYRHVGGRMSLSRELGDRIYQAGSRRPKLENLDRREKEALLKRLERILDVHDKDIVKFSEVVGDPSLSRESAEVLIVHYSLEMYRSLREVLEDCREEDWIEDEHDIRYWNEAIDVYVEKLVKLYNLLQPDAGGGCLSGPSDN